MPEGAIYVGRPTKWGNPFRITDLCDRDEVLARYTAWIAEPGNQGIRHAAVAELAGHDLVCWCPVGLPCHADILLEIAADRS
jgi:hypothetical protein